MKSENKTVLLDARELVPMRMTGIGRVLRGLAGALADADFVDQVVLAIGFPAALPVSLKARNKIRLLRVPASFLASEMALSRLSAKSDLFVSPYPKLPLFGTYCPTIHIIHDVLDLTHPQYRMRLKTVFDGWRLKKALKRADLTWYDSSWSMEETKRYAGHPGRNPKVRYPGIDERFTPSVPDSDAATLSRYDLTPRYILCVGNGLPHKNLGVLLEISHQLKRNFVIVGVSRRNQSYWKSKYPQADAVWIEHSPDEDLPALMRNSFCLVLPSTMEGYGYPPLEAMACGTPTVASDIPVLRETTGGASLYADPLRPSEWTECVNSLENPNFRGAVTKRGFDWVRRFRGPQPWLPYLTDLEEICT
ncbi:MAG: glycosyltransferase family 1 protein [Thermodesulfobacteriota bacterium]